MSALRIRMQPCDTAPGIRSGPFGAVDADVATAGPVRQRRRPGARAERDRAVERAPVAGEAVADDELAARRRRVRRADADRAAHHRAAVPQQRGAAADEVHDQVRARRPVGAERTARHPAGGPVRQRRQPDAEPQLAVGTSPAGERQARCSSSPRASPRAAFRRRGAEAEGRRRATTSRRTAAQRGLVRVALQRHGRPDRDRGLRRSGQVRRALAPFRGDAAGAGDEPPPGQAGDEQDRGRRGTGRPRRASSRELRLAPAARLHDEARVLDDRRACWPWSAARRTRRRRARSPRAVGSTRRAAPRPSGSRARARGRRGPGSAAPGPCRPPPRDPRRRRRSCGSAPRPRSRRGSRSAGA